MYFDLINKNCVLFLFYLLYVSLDFFHKFSFYIKDHGALSLPFNIVLYRSFSGESSLSQTGNFNNLIRLSECFIVTMIDNI